MHYRLANYSGIHGDTTYYNVVEIYNTAVMDSYKRHYISGHEVAICQLKSDNLWWITSNYSDPSYFPDVGPFDDVETAIMNLILMSDVK